MAPGQKVCCVDDTFPAWVQQLYLVLPVKGRVYVIRNTERGTTFCDGRESEQELCVHLIGLHNPRSTKAPLREMGFRAVRFRPLDELQKRESVAVADAIGVELVTVR